MDKRHNTTVKNNEKTNADKDLSKEDNIENANKGYNPTSKGYSDETNNTGNTNNAAGVTENTNQTADGAAAEGETKQTVTDSNAQKTFNNPIKSSGADPWVVYHKGFYYSCYSNGEDKIFVSKTKKLEDLEKANEVLVWQAPKGTSYSRETWAPELHFINSKWYIYFAADDGKNENHRMYCLQGLSDNPQGKYEFKGKLAVSEDRWAIDGTVLNRDGKLYFIWSGWEGTVNVRQNIYIARMSNPYTLTGERVCLSTPTFDWETIGDPKINEGPTVLIKNGVTHIVYSASGSWTDDYCLGLLSNEKGDFMDPSAWKKSGPVFSKVDTAYGPGHCSFTKSPDGKEDWIVYHANVINGSSWGGRSVRAQSFTWDGNYPVFGEPVPVDEAISTPSGE